MLGYEDAEILGQPGAILFTPEDRAVNAPVLETEKATFRGYTETVRPFRLAASQSRYGFRLAAPLIRALVSLSPLAVRG